jgi:hypothetical protein
MVQRQIFEYALAARGQTEQHQPPVLAGNLPMHVARFGKAIDQLDRTVVLDVQTPGQFADAGANFPRKPFESEHELMLAWFEANGTGGTFAVGQKYPNLKT